MDRGARHSSEKLPNSRFLEIGERPHFKTHVLRKLQELNLDVCALIAGALYTEILSLDMAFGHTAHPIAVSEDDFLRPGFSFKISPQLADIVD